MLKIGIVGFGYWGPNLVRNFSKIDECNVVAIVDKSIEQQRLVRKSYPQISVYSEFSDLLTSAIDAVVIATPVFTHFNLARLALKAGKHVLLEKPMTSSLIETMELKKIADENKLTLMVDHTFLYTGAVQKMKQLIEENQLGKLQYFDSTRINLGLFQSDINVLWDLAPHDISILNYLVNKKAYSVNATGISHIGNGIENIAYLTINYEDDFIAHLNCSWTSPVKVRSTLIGGDEKMLVYNDLEPTEKVRLYDSGYKLIENTNKESIKVDYRIGDVYIPKLTTNEALYGVAMDFISSIKNSTKPLSDVLSGLSVVNILEAAQKSIKNKGEEIIIEWN